MTPGIPAAAPAPAGIAAAQVGHAVGEGPCPATPEKTIEPPHVGTPSSLSCFRVRLYKVTRREPRRKSAEDYRPVLGTEIFSFLVGAPRFCTIEINRSRARPGVKPARGRRVVVFEGLVFGWVMPGRRRRPTDEE